MKTKKFSLKNVFGLQTLCCMALLSATLTANLRCAYIFHNPEKPDALKQLRKF